MDSNTSYVAINLVNRKRMFLLFLYSNTSYVAINQVYINKPKRKV